MGHYRQGIRNGLRTKNDVWKKLKAEHPNVSGFPARNIRAQNRTTRSLSKWLLTNTTIHLSARLVMNNGDHFICIKMLLLMSTKKHKHASAEVWSLRDTSVRIITMWKTIYQARFGICYQMSETVMSIS